jgi:hypothetical protein
VSILFREWPYKSDAKRVTASEMTNEQLIHEFEKARNAAGDVNVKWKILRELRPEINRRGLEQVL